MPRTICARASHFWRPAARTQLARSYRNWSPGQKNGGWGLPIDTGNVAEDDEVPKAVANALLIFLMK